MSNDRSNDMTNDDTRIGTDDLRRELRDADRQHHEVDRSWRTTLRSLFDPERGTSEGERAAFLGLPDRRGFLRVGGVGIAGAALLAACGDDTERPASSAASGSTGGSTGGSTDLTLAKTAASLESLAIDAYTTAIGSGLVTTAAIGDAAKLFQSHHQAHLDALQALLQQSGAAKVTVANAAVKAAVVDPAVKAARTEADIVALAFALEDAAAQTYVYATTQLSTPALRSTLMTIAGVEARHRAILAFLVQKKAPTEIFPAGFFKAENPLPADAIVR